MPRIPLTSASLFGNEAAEDEAEETFHSVLVERREAAEFGDAERPILIVSAYKGEGKSALLRALRSKLSQDPSLVVVGTNGPGATPNITGGDVSSWNRGWKESLFLLIAVHVGAKLGAAWNDDTIALVEEAEKNGFRRRSVFSAIFDRLSPSLDMGGALSLSAGRERQGPANVEETLRRIDPDSLSEIWLVVDDIDRNFKNTKQERAKIVGFFDAVREMCNAVPQLRVRSSIRPNVYATVKLHFESLSHVRQYMLPIYWSADEIRAMLARRIEGFLQRSNQIHELRLPASGPERDLRLIALVFETPVTWGAKTRPIHVPLYTLSAHRPRWVVELCKVAARHAAARRQTQIHLSDITAEMGEFGSNRRADAVAEFGPQCPELSDLIDAFDGQAAEYSTEELFRLVGDRILTKLTPQIAGVAGRPTEADVASFLFEVGLFFGRRDLGNSEYEHVAFAQKPSLFRSKTNADDGLRWEVHPVFRQALGMRSPSGSEYRKRH